MQREAAIEVIDELEGVRLLLLDAIKRDKK